MSEMSGNESSSSLPRGLVTKGIFASNQRLPSLRLEAQSNSQSQSTPVSTMLATTKGGAVKRLFKPTIPVRPRANDDSNSTSSQLLNSSRHGRPAKFKSRTNAKQSQDRHRLIQTEAVVFNGENGLSEPIRKRLDRSHVDSAHSKTDSDRLHKSSRKSTEKLEMNVKVEKKANLIRKLYGDNFIDDDDYEDNDNVLLPKGWQTVSSHRVVKSYDSEPLTPYNLLNNDNHDKLFLMQIPEAMLNRKEGHIGKMRVYKSGRIELVDNESGVKFDVLFGNNHPLHVKNEHKTAKETGVHTPDISQDVVSFSGDHLTTLGSLRQEVLIAVPQIPLEDHIGPTIQL